MTKISIGQIKLKALQKTARENFSKNLAGLKQFTEKEMPSIIEKQTELQNSLEKLAQAAKAIQKGTIDIID